MRLLRTREGPAGAHAVLPETGIQQGIRIFPPNAQGGGLGPIAVITQ